MKKEWITIMKNTGRLKMSFGDYITHYFVVIFLFLPLLFVSFDLIKLYITNSYHGVRTVNEMLGISIPFALTGVCFYFIQHKRLRFNAIQTSLSKEQLNAIIALTAEQLEWRSEKDTKYLSQWTTNPPWWSGSWGEQITIIFDKDRVLVNSICDPNKRTSVVSVGRNKKNVNVIIERIRAAEN